MAHKFYLSREKQVVLFDLLERLFNKVDYNSIDDVELLISRDYFNLLSDLLVDLKLSLDK